MNLAAWRAPFSISSAWRSESRWSWSILLAMSWGSWGSEKRALSSPQISGIEEEFEATTGVPQLMDSRGGRPKPS